MFAGSRFCAHCGAEATRAVVEETTPLTCPRCREPMQALLLGATKVRECAQCGGLWLDPETLQRLADARESHSDVVGVLAARLPATAGAPDVVRYIPCPSCGKLMNRVNFAHSSGIVLDVCKTHGLWLDRGELQRVLEFIDAGGLAVARKRDMERLVEEQRRLEALKDRPQSGGGLSVNVDGAVYSQSGSDGASSALLWSHVLGDAISLFRLL
jgi:Zn-finger nucleic acid-binding protein